MTPIRIMRGSRLKAVLGASGGRRIWTAVAQAIVNYLDCGLSLQEAVEAPRLHAETDDLIIDGRFGAKVELALERRGHRAAAARPHLP